MHCIDLHLDSRFRLTTRIKAEQRQAGCGLCSMMLFAKTEGVDLMLAGDLFDMIMRAGHHGAYGARVASDPKCKFIIAPGNRPYTPDSIWAKYQFPDTFIFLIPTNCRIFV